MIKNIYILTLFLFQLTIALGQDCDDGYTDVGGECYYLEDFDVLETFINNSSGSINLILDTDNDGIIAALELCSQAWENGRLTSLDCGPIIIDGNYNWLSISGEIPSNITNWTQIEPMASCYLL